MSAAYVPMAGRPAGLRVERSWLPVPPQDSSWGEAPRTPVNLLSQQAALWDASRFSPDLVLRGGALAEAEEWAAAHAADLTDVECDYLAECRCARRQAQRLAGQHRLVQGLALLVTLAALIATHAAWQGQGEQAELTETQGALSAQLIAKQAELVTSRARLTELAGRAESLDRWAHEENKARREAELGLRAERVFGQLAEDRFWLERARLLQALAAAQDDPALAARLAQEAEQALGHVRPASLLYSQAASTPAAYWGQE
ncbi:MAG: hypothetical protein GXY76_02910 [Chloroflexi bacterium]|nr:hypothetical protein [Chloroflexota bacterium]